EPWRRCDPAPPAARILRSTDPRRCRPLVAEVPARPAACAQPPAVEGDVLAMGLVGPRRQHGAGPGIGTGPPGRLRVRAGARTLPPDPGQPLARVLARSGTTLPRLARAARLFPAGRATPESNASATAVAL